jgi:hypothetical protein
MVDASNVPRADTLVVGPEFRDVVTVLRQQTQLPILIPKDMRWAATPRALVACHEGKSNDRGYQYYIVDG